MKKDTFTFGKATDISSFAKNHDLGMYVDCKAVFIAPDTNDYHILRVIEGYGDDYEQVEGSFILEVQKIGKPRCEYIRSLKHLTEILDDDDGSNYGYLIFTNYEDVIEHIDSGYGINKL